jgi:hypothetical protein
MTDTSTQQDIAPGLVISFDTLGYPAKPSTAEIKSIFSRLSKVEVHEHSMEEIREKILCGHTFVPGTYEGIKKNENWRSQQIVALDFDGRIALDEFWKIVADYEVEPFFVYRSFSDGQKPGDSFRALFACDQTVTDVRVWNWILRMFKYLFEIPKSNRRSPSDTCYADNASFTLSQMFFGTTSEKQVRYSPEMNFNPIDVYEAIKYKIKYEDPKHWKSKFETVCRKEYFLNQYVRFRDFDLMGFSSSSYTIEQEGFSRFLLPEDHPHKFAILEISSSSVKSNRFSSSNFSLEKTQYVDPNNSSTENANSRTENSSSRLRSAGETGIQDDCTAGSAGPGTRRTRDLSAEDLRTLDRSCRFHHEYTEGKTRWKRDQRIRYFANIAPFRNVTGIANKGFERFNAERGNEEPYSKGSHERLLDTIRKGGLNRPSKCSNFCPYATTCNPNGYPTDKLGKRRGEFRKLSDYTCTPEITLEEARAMLKERLDHVMSQADAKVYVIVAETSIGKTTQILNRDLSGCMIAFKTHALKEEAYASLSDAQRQGVYRWVEPPKLPDTLQAELEARYKLGYANTLELYKQAKNYVIVRKKPYWKKAIEDYLQATKDIQFQSCIFATHKKALHVIENKNIHTIIFDDNPINTLKEALQASSNNDEYTPDRVILPEDKKIVILTADRDIPELKNIVAPERIEIIQLPPIIKMGNLYINPQRSYSKHCINQDQERFVDEVREAVEKYKLDGVITHLEFREILEDNGITVFTHFGAVEGTNQFNGKNIGIFGVPHLPPEAIRQAQNLFGIKPGTEIKYTERSIQRNGYEFDFYTASTDNDIAEIGLSTIENQLNQSIGRSRLQIFDSNVYFFGNFVPANYVKFLAQ